MASSNALISWFDLSLDVLSETPIANDITAAVPFLSILADPPTGITQYKLNYRNIPLKRSGPKGWTYFPASPDGTRLARVSYGSPKPHVYITGMVKLINYETDDESETWTVSEHALVTIDNLNGHGKVEMRENNQRNKRRKIVHN